MTPTSCDTELPAAAAPPVRRSPGRSRLARPLPPLYDRWFVAAFVSQTCFALANTLMSHYARWVEFLGGGVRDVGWVMGGGAAAGLLLRPWVGQWINRLGPRITWAAGYGVFALGSLGNLFLDHMGWEVYLLRTCLVLGAAIVFASSLTYVTQTAPAERRTEAIGILGAGGFLGMLSGPYLGDLILGAADRSRGDFTVLFVAVPAAVLASAALLLLLRPSQAKSDRGASLADFVRTAARYWPGPILLVNFAFGVCMAVPFGFLASYVDAAGLAAPGFSPIGLFFLAYAGWGLTLRVGLRRLPDRAGRRKVLLAGVACMGVGMYCFLLVRAAHPWMLLAPAIVCGAGHGLMFHTMTSLALERFPDRVRGTGSALSLMTMDLGVVVGAPVLGQAAAWAGYGALFSLAGGICLAAGGVYAWTVARRGGKAAGPLPG